MSRRLGLIIGVNYYQDTVFQPLQFAENDARALAQWLVNVKGGKWSPPDVQLVNGAHVTKELVESLILQTCLNMAEANDTVLLYFAGHAFVDERSGEGYLALTNTRYQDPTATGLHLASFAHYVLQRSRAAQILFILDCFQDGQAWSMRRTAPYDTKPLLESVILNVLPSQRNRLFLCSCRGNEFVPEAGEKGLGAFMYRMILGLCGSASGSGTEAITLQQLYSYLTGNLNEQQRPQLFGQEQSPVILVGEVPPQSGSQQMLPVTGTSPLAYAGMTATAQQSPRTTRTLSGQLFKPVVEPQRQQPQQMLGQAQQLLQMQNFSEALTIVEQLLQIAPQEVSALLLKGQILDTMGRTREALAAVEQILLIDSNNPLIWKTRAALLANMGHHPMALTSIERSLALDTSNPDAQALKTIILANIAKAQNKNSDQRPQNPFPFSDEKLNNTFPWFMSAGIQVLAEVIGVVGAILPSIQPHLSIIIGLVLASLGMATLCINAALGAYRYGFWRLLPTLLLCLVTGGLLAAIYKFGYTKIIGLVKMNPPLLLSLLFFAAWLAAAATIPIIVAIGGWISGLIARRAARS